MAPPLLLPPATTVHAQINPKFQPSHHASMPCPCRAPSNGQSNHHGLTKSASSCPLLLLPFVAAASLTKAQLCRATASSLCTARAAAPPLLSLLLLKK
ncbi:hypothetical protein M0R45_024997 [Rubus argutus]|uniref:Uncharacterized protein n=1 Tax=Rubus argutus TaxID=59490 RepID=A0AAW1WUR8_RUBAR